MQEPPRRRALWPWLVIPLVLVVAGAIGAVLAVRANSRDTSTRPAPVSTVPPARRQTIRAEAAAGSVTVPDVRGQELPDALEEIRDAGLVPDQQEARSSLPKKTVVAQSPGPGAEAKRGDHVVLTVSQGSPPGHEDKGEGKHGRGHGHGPKDRNR